MEYHITCEICSNLFRVSDFLEIQEEASRGRGAFYRDCTPEKLHTNDVYRSDVNSKLVI